MCLPFVDGIKFSNLQNPAIPLQMVNSSSLHVPAAKLTKKETLHNQQVILSKQNRDQHLSPNPINRTNAAAPPPTSKSQETKLTLLHRRLGLPSWLARPHLRAFNSCDLTHKHSTARNSVRISEKMEGSNQWNQINAPSSPARTP
jgi:hypothetical protein